MELGSHFVLVRPCISAAVFMYYTKHCAFELSQLSRQRLSCAQLLGSQYIKCGQSKSRPHKKPLLIPGMSESHKLLG